jgi:WD40 repeat protein/class 3 adenylate cyclase
MPDLHLLQPPFQDFPEGTVTFLFTDIEGSTQLLHRLREQYAALLSDQRHLLRQAFNHWDGREVDTQGDAFCVAFRRATQAVAAAVEAQRLLAEHTWPEDISLRVRMGIHTGEPWKAEEGYVGIDLHRAARICHVSHGGQVLLSETVTALVMDELPQGVILLDLGRHLLKDIHRPERIHQLVIEGLPSEFPPLKSLEVLPSTDTRLPRLVGDCPYRGLAAFQESDVRFYFGREAFGTLLQHAISIKRRITVVVGSSGSGKSSALFAGLLPKLRAEKGWQIVILRSGIQPFYSIAGALLPLLEPNLSENERLVETRILAENLRKGDTNLLQVVERVQEKHANFHQMLLVIDQFEELYTLCPEPDLQHRFIDELLAVAYAETGRRIFQLVILLTMRADFMGQALAYRPFADAMQKSSLLMGPMTQEELREAIEKPAEMQGAAFEPGLVERILDDVGNESGNLPLLEFALTLLWERQSDGWLTHADYEALGCVEGALACYADKVYEGLQPDEQERARRALVQLVRPGEDTADTRRIATREELGKESWELIRYLADQRLVVTGWDTVGIETAEVVHETLIQKWSRFQEWMSADRAFRSWQERLRGNVRQWQESEYDNGALLVGVPLLEAENWLSERLTELSEAEQQFILSGIMLREQQAAELESQRQRELEAARRLAESEGRRAEEQAQAAGRLRRRALLLAGASFVAVILAAIAFLAFREANQNANTAQIASSQAETQQALAEEQLQLSTSRELAAAAVANLHVDSERSVLLALEALSKANTLEALNSLHQALPELRVLNSTIADDTVIYSVSFNPDGTRLATSGYDGTAKIWDTSSLRLLLTLKTDFKDVFDVDWSPDGTRLATSGVTDVLIWDTITGQKVLTLPGGSVGHTVGLYLGVGRVDFSPDGTRLAIANQDGVPKVWDLAAEKPILSLDGHTEICWEIAYSPDGDLLATGSYDGIVKIWDAQSGKELHSILSHNSPIGGLAFSPDGTQLVSVHESGYLIVWDIATGDTKLSLTNPSAGAFSSTVFLPDGSGFVTSAYDSTARIWDLATGRQRLLLAGHSGTIMEASVSPDGRILATGGVGGALKIWDLDLSHEVLTLDVQPGAAGKVIFARDGSSLAAAATDGKIRIWDRTTGELVNELTTDALHPWKGPLAYTIDGAYMAAGASDGVWALWELATGKTLAVVPGHTNMIASLVFSPDGLHLATSSFDGTVKIWDYSKTPETGELPVAVITFTNHIQPGTTSNWVFDVVFSPNGQLVASAGADSLVRVWDPLSGQEQLELPGLEGAGSMTAVAFSPDGILIAGGQLNGMICMWEAATGKLIHTIPGHSAGVFALDFNANGTLLASASFDLMAKIWDVQSGREVASLYGNTGRVMGIAFSPDGTQVATGGEDGTVRLFAVRMEDLVALARSRVTRSLTTEECQKYLHVDACP